MQPEPGWICPLPNLILISLISFLACRSRPQRERLAKEVCQSAACDGGARWLRLSPDIIHRVVEDVMKRTAGEDRPGTGQR